MVIKYLKPSDSIIHYAHRISYYAHMPWVVAFFFVIFLLDSVFMFIPSDGLLAVAILFAPDKKKIWFVMAVLGVFLGFLIFYFLTLSSFQHLVINLITQYDTGEYFKHITTHAAKYGYFDLSLAVFTIVPPVICMMAGIVIGLNPWIVFVIVFVSKIFRICLMIFLVRKLWSAVILLKHKIHDRRVAKKSHTDEVSK